MSGRYNKHDTARLRFIRSIALPGIRFGQLVPDDDMRMLRLGPMNVLHGVDLASMDEWAQRHGRDPRSKKKDGWLDETEQATLFRWLSSNEKHLVVSNSARRGAPRAFQLDFGAYEGHRLEQLVRHSIQSGGRTHLLLAAPGPLPIAADVVRLHGADAADVVTREAPLPAEVEADPQVVLLPVPAAGERDAEGRTRDQVLAANRSRRRNARLTPEAREASNKKRRDRGDKRNDARARRRRVDEGEEEGDVEEEDE